LPLAPLMPLIISPRDAATHAGCQILLDAAAAADIFSSPPPAIAIFRRFQPLMG
jgi:hypothetical protein